MSGNIDTCTRTSVTRSVVLQDCYIHTSVSLACNHTRRGSFCHRTVNYRKSLRKKLCRPESCAIRAQTKQPGRSTGFPCCCGDAPTLPPTNSPLTGRFATPTRALRVPTQKGTLDLKTRIKTIHTYTPLQENANKIQFTICTS